MSGCGRRLIFVFAGIALSFTATVLASDTRDEPYYEIANRNAFGIKAPPLKTVESPQPAELRRKVSLVGITTILGRKIAFLTVISSERAGLRESLVLVEGQTQDGIEVKEIDEKAGTVKVINHGQEQTLDFDQNSAPTLHATKS